MNKYTFFCGKRFPVQGQCSSVSLSQEKNLQMFFVVLIFLCLQISLSLPVCNISYQKWLWHWYDCVFMYNHCIWLCHSILFNWSNLSTRVHSKASYKHSHHLHRHIIILVLQAIQMVCILLLVYPYKMTKKLESFNSVGSCCFLLPTYAMFSCENFPLTRLWIPTFKGHKLGNLNQLFQNQ